MLRDNTFFNSSFGSLVTTNSRNLTWPDPAYKYDITKENNTFVNFNTVSARSPLLNFRYTSSGSKFTVRNNLFVLTKATGDYRNLAFNGADIRYLQGACTDRATFDFYNNWSTADNIENGQIFTTGAFSATRNSFGKWLDNPDVAEYPHGADELKVHVANISAAELMCQPDPLHKVYAEGAYTSDRHRTESIDGIGVVSANLYFKNFDNDIVRNNVGASKWRVKQETGITSVNVSQTKDGTVYNLAGQRISEPVHGVYIKNGRKYVK